MKVNMKGNDPVIVMNTYALASCALHDTVEQCCGIERATADNDSK